MRHNSEIILRSLLAGIPVVKEDQIYVFDETYRLCVEYDKYQDGKYVGKTLMVLYLGIGLSDFIVWCDEFTDEEIAIVASNLTLNKKLGVKNGRY